MFKPQPQSHIHLMGICGTAMASLAGLLKAHGYKVTGSDSNPYPPMSTQIEKLGIPLMHGYSEKNLHPQPDFVIVGNVISASNPEAQELIRLKIPYTSLPQAMGEFIIADRESVVVAGTHGKTTTTSLMAWVAEQCGQKPGFLIGGIPKNFELSFKKPESNLFVIEGDEYDTAYFDKVPKFIHYKPRHVILTSIEFDHADIYKNIDEIKAAFARLLELIPDEGTLLVSAEDQNIKSILGHSKVKKTLTYGFSDADFKVEKKKVDDSGSEFEVFYKNKSLGLFSMSLAGDYNILNATAVVALAFLQGFPMEQVKSGLKSFAGVKRRQEVLGEPGGVLIIEDFAHHPTAVRETLKGIKERYKSRKIHAVFEPRSATSRRKVFQNDYVQAFLAADHILIAQAFDQSKINETDRFSSEELVMDLKKQNKNAQVFAQVDSIVAELKNTARSGDLVIIMSNGGFDGIYKKLLTALSQ